jgi:hypothetical protein
MLRVKSSHRSKDGVGVKKIEVIFLIWIFFFVACEKKTPPPQGKSENPSVPKVIVEKDRMEKEQPLPPEVKIKLKKDGKESYSWELTGSDVDQILKVNEKLRKQLGGEQTK